MKNTRPLPKWAMIKYALLWSRFKNKEFDYESAVRLLQEKNSNLVSVLLNYFKRHNWMKIKLNPTDSRKRAYKLKSPSEVVENMIIVKQK